MSDETESLNDQGADQEVADLDRQEAAKKAQEAAAKPPKPFASLAQARRCDTLAAEGAVAWDVFKRDLLASDLETIPWRKGPAKPEDPDQAGQDEFRAALIARKAALQTPAEVA